MTIAQTATYAPRALDGLPQVRRFGEVVAFGDESAIYASRLPERIPALVCNGVAVEAALAEATRLRREGTPFLVAPQLHDKRALLARNYAPLLLQQPHVDERRKVFEALAHGTISIGAQAIYDVEPYAPAVLGTLRELIGMGDALLVRSQVERARCEALFGTLPRCVAVAPLADPDVPACAPAAGADRVVVWSPGNRAESLALYVYALWELKTPAVFVCEGDWPGTPHEYVPYARAAEALERAAVVVDTGIGDPGTAIAFAGRGFGVVAAATSGAHEHVQGLRTYRPTDVFTILGAVSQARADRRTRALPSTPVREALARALELAAPPPPPPDAPLVSIVLPTYNRRACLRRNLDAFARQTYPNLEVVVVNDAGEPVDDVVAAYPFARLVETGGNVGVTKANNVGLKAARGAYLGLLADDDLEYPDHVARLVAALVDSGLEVAHTNVVVRLQTATPDGVAATYGHRLAYDGFHDPTQALYAMPIHAAGYLISREAFARIDYLDEARVCNSDHDLTLRLNRHYDFAHVERVTAEMEYRDDGTNGSAMHGSALADEVREMLASHLPPDRPLIAERQARTVEGVANNQRRGTFYVPWIRLDPPLPHASGGRAR